MDALGRALLGESLAARGWTFDFDRARKRLGACHQHRREITLSSYLTRSLSEDEVEETLRHEIAHAIDVEKRGTTGHDATWKAIATACGARPERCHSGPLPWDPKAPYLAECPSCEKRCNLYRQPVRPPHCPDCAESGRPAYVRVVHRRSERVIWSGGADAGAFGGTAGVAAACPRCGEVYRRARRPRRRTACADCCQRFAGGQYDARFHLEYSKPPRLG